MKTDKRANSGSGRTELAENGHETRRKPTRTMVLVPFERAALPPIERRQGKLDEAVNLAAAIERMNAEIGIPSGLTEMGIVEEDIPGLIEYALKDLSARSNPRRCSAEDFEKMIRESL